MKDETKEFVGALAGTIVGACGGMVIRKAAGVYLDPRVIGEVKPIVYNTALYGIQSAASFAIGKAVHKDVIDIIEGAESWKSLADIWKNAKKSVTISKEVKDDGGDSDAGQQQSEA